MTNTKNAQIVQQAEIKRLSSNMVKLESHSQLIKSKLFKNSKGNQLHAYTPYAQALKEANDHITVRPDEIEAAADAYKEVANCLVQNLNWPDESIKIHVQGSASTQTLIRSPNSNEKFDIDAVCQVDINQITANNPMGFFNAVGDSLKDLKAEAKKRCWKIPFSNRKFYLEFTPSVPLGTVPQYAIESMAPKYSAGPEYRETALAVVDTPTKKWKTSNPAGITKWVEDTANRNLIHQIALESDTFTTAEANVAPVPDQDVELTDTLRITIRLFKRHRDMCVHRNIFHKDVQPISIIIVTLLTSGYAGLADLGRTFEHPIEVLAELASLMPFLVNKTEGEYIVTNPTVEGENFAEKWNTDNQARLRAFETWCKKLSADLKIILEEDDQQKIIARVREVFGIPIPSSEGSNLHKRVYITHTPPGRGLA